MTKKIILNGQQVEIDDMCVELVTLLNAHGFTTQFSCQGHNEHEGFSIIFDRSVTDGMIYELARAYEMTNNYLDEDSYPMYPFSKWVRYNKLIEDDGSCSGYFLMENWQLTIETDSIRGSESRRAALVKDLTNHIKEALNNLKLIKLP